MITKLYSKNGYSVQINKTQPEPYTLQKDKGFKIQGLNIPIILAKYKNIAEAVKQFNLLTN